ncbi:hypothetical protein DSM106972_015950 [Dulcicalothrix desertica PCC 7102]|uniref:Uncharacterized protein n=1 Tax=Dulcicalothrix desertica PCC 7102 TaxID=232991 RepID=A0A3S1CSB4_9CYAN|nr:hypothetical protein [Dulcicalothrix desertica]RUT08427.1 hypothetical protein DSM106972_015950 [Dulcicalothrix desertica PCC 7102]TWH40292.1 hypothetical protein CAL7102_09599 [Dulcicalothrix desertica PCC 7102]
MITYCSEGDKPIVKYSFNGVEKKFKSPKSPITIETKETPIEGSDSYQAEGFTITFYSPNNSRFVEATVLDYKVFKEEIDGILYNSIKWKNCGETSFQSSVEIDPQTLTIDATKKCPIDQQGKVRCSIIIRHQDLIIFQDQGQCPLIYSVQCGNCASGEIECKSNTYPGYCCISCQGTSQRIKNLSNKIK